MKLVAIEKALKGTRPGRWSYENGCALAVLGAHADLPPRSMSAVMAHYDLTAAQLGLIAVTNDNEDDPAKRVGAIIAALYREASFLDRVRAWWDRLKVNGVVTDYRQDDLYG